MHSAAKRRTMFRRTFSRCASLGAVACVAAAIAVPAQAHNAGHFFLPDGTCHEIGSFNPAPVVGQDKTQLDLIPETPTVPFDEYGASFAAFQGDTPILPGGCPR
jgi:hypothetical protein